MDDGPPSCKVGQTKKYANEIQQLVVSMVQQQTQVFFVDQFH